MIYAFSLFGLIRDQLTNSNFHVIYMSDLRVANELRQKDTGRAQQAVDPMDVDTPGFGWGFNLKRSLGYPATVPGDAARAVAAGKLAPGVGSALALWARLGGSKCLFFRALRPRFCGAGACFWL